jgi:hypothetical protein
MTNSVRAWYGGGGVNMEQLFFDDFPVHKPNRNQETKRCDINAALFEESKIVVNEIGRKRIGSHLLQSEAQGMQKPRMSRRGSSIASELTDPPHFLARSSVTGIYFHV